MVGLWQGWKAICENMGEERERGDGGEGFVERTCVLCWMFVHKCGVHLWCLLFVTVKQRDCGGGPVG